MIEHCPLGDTFEEGFSYSPHLLMLWELGNRHVPNPLGDTFEEELENERHGGQ